MNFYQELTLIPDPEISPYFLWSKLYTQLHIALVDIKNNHGIDTIGVNFPGYQHEENEGGKRTTLGNKLRVFSHQKQALDQLDLARWLERMSDYIHIERIAEVGKHQGLVVVRRYRFKNTTKQALAFAEHRSISFEEALAHCKKHKQANKNYPFILLKSQSNDCFYRLSIMQDEADQVHEGQFNTYGINNLSGNVTVPHW